MPADATTTDKGNANVAIRGSQLDLGSQMKFVFNIKENYTGTLVIDGRTYNVEGGLVGGKSYVTVQMRAYDMFDSEKYIAISGVSSDGTEFEGSYALRAYIEGKAGDTTLTALLEALYTYCAEAYANKYGVEVERPENGDTPVFDADVDWQ